MIISSVSLKYARALADVALENRIHEQVLRELSAVDQLLKTHKDLRETFANPAIPLAAKRGIMEELGRRMSLSKVVVNFVLVLLEKARIHQFEQMAGAYQRVLDERQGIIQADVFSVQAVNDSVKRRLHDAVSGLTGKRVKMNYQQDASLIGGIKMQIGSTVFDGSIRTQLEEIRKRLAME